MLRIRLSRVGKKNTPIYKVVVAEKSRPVKGKFIESLGVYNPGNKDQSLNAERIKYWISVGAQPSQTVHNLLIRQNIIEATKIPVTRFKASESK
jgi:small subunit ribosomal protein S16